MKIRVELTGVLIIRIEEASINDFVEALLEFVIYRGEKLTYHYHKTKEYLYLYSSQFECISGIYAKNLIRFLMSRKEWFLYLQIYGADKMLICLRNEVNIQVYCSNKNLWGIDLSHNNYIQMDEILIAAYQGPEKIMENLKRLMIKLRLEVFYGFSGYDKLATSEFLHYHPHLMGKKHKKDTKYKGSSVFSKYVERTGNDLFLLSEQGIIQVSSKVLSYMEDLNNRGCKAYFFNRFTFEGLKKYDHYTDLYLILDQSSDVRFRLKGEEHYFGYDEIIVRLEEVNREEFSIEEINGSTMIVLYQGNDLNHSCFYDWEKKEMWLSMSGVSVCNDHMTLYRHKERKILFENRHSEWNIDSSTGVKEVYPVIAVSRIRRRIEKNNGKEYFKKYRQREKLHMHPTFSELYYCEKGSMVMILFLNEGIREFEIKEGQYALLMPDTPHFIFQIGFNRENRYSHICVQFLSLLHQGMHEVKRDCFFDMEEYVAMKELDKTKTDQLRNEGIYSDRYEKGIGKKN